MTQFDYKDTYLPNSIFRETAQVCIVAHDADQMVRQYADRLGIGPWWVKDYEPPELRDTTYRGVPTQFSMRIGLAWTGALNWEIIAPKEGPSIYKDFLKEHGEGIHHIACFLKDTGMNWDACYKSFGERGFEPIQDGSWGGVRFCYFDTESAGRTIIEVLERRAGWVRPEPLYWYPPQP